MLENPTSIDTAAEWQHIDDQGNVSSGLYVVITALSNIVCINLEVVPLFK